MINIRDFIKDIIKKVFGITVIQKIFVNILYFYCWLVYKTSKLTLVGTDKLETVLLKNKPFLLMTWHGRFGLLGHIFKYYFCDRLHLNIKKFYTLNSKHRDGMIGHLFSQQLGYNSILGSTVEKISKNRVKKDTTKFGSFGAIVSIMRELQKGAGIFITPDGPRGPANKVNGKMVEIAKKYNTTVLTIALSYSKKYILHSWDKMQIPLPFGKIYMEVVDVIDTNVDTDVEATNKLIENQLNKIFINDKKIENDEI